MADIIIMAACCLIGGIAATFKAHENKNVEMGMVAGALISTAFWLLVFILVSL